MTELNISLEQLRGMIGLRVQHRGVTCCIIEVLEDGPSLVLQNGEARLDLQNNQYGGPGRQVPETYTVPVVSPDQRELHDEFLSLELLDSRCSV
jgi:hypothetical protein